MGWYTDYYIFVVLKNDIRRKKLLERIIKADPLIKKEISETTNNKFFDEILGFGNLRCTRRINKKIIDETIQNKYTGCKLLLTTDMKRGNLSDLQYLVALINKIFADEIIYTYGTYDGEDSYAEMQLDYSEINDDGTPRGSPNDRVIIVDNGSKQ